MREGTANYVSVGSDWLGCTPNDTKDCDVCAFVGGLTPNDIKDEGWTPWLAGKESIWVLVCSLSSFYESELQLGTFT